MTTSQLASIIEPEIIQKTLEKVLEFQNTLTLKQKTFTEQTTAQAQLAMINYYTNELILRPANHESPFCFQKDFPITVQNDSHSIEFSTQLGGIVRPQYLSLFWPSKIMKNNTRSARRYNFEQKHYTINFSNFSLPITSVSNLLQEGQIVDISRTGIGIKITHKIVEDYEEKDRLVFSTINNFPLEKKITGSIVYIRRINKWKEPSYYFMGIEFDKMIPFEDILAKLGHKINPATALP